MTEIAGACTCGAVRYSGTAEPAFIGVCHCKNCQRQTGSAFSVVVGLPAAAVSVTGPVKVFTGAGDSGKPTHRRFCPECGTSVLEEAELMPGIAMIPVGTLDDPGWVKPGVQIYCDSAQPWVSLSGNFKSFAKMPTNE